MRFLPRGRAGAHPLRRAGRWLQPAALAFLALSGTAISGEGRAAAEEQLRPKQVVIAPGDTLTGLAMRFYGSPAAVERIMAANKISDANTILAGTALVLPDSSTPAAPAAPSSAGSASAAIRTITVEPGDTLSAISMRVYGTSAFAGAIAAANGITDPNLVFAGAKLTVPASPPAATGNAAGPGSAPRSGSAAAAASSGPLAGKRICLDPGHGGNPEPGATYSFSDGKVLREAEVTLDISKTLRAWLEADGAQVTITRNSDLFLSLESRAYLCNNAGADIALSIHMNGGDDPNWNGALTLFFKEIDKRLAETVATALHVGLAKSAPGMFFNYGARSFSGTFLSGTTMPAIIVEPVFITNPDEARALLAPTAVPTSRRNQIVLEIYRGVRMYFAAGR